MWTIKNNISEIKKISQFLEEFNKKQNLKANVIFSVNLAAGEIVKNIIKYGYEDSKKHIIKLCFSQDKNKSHIIVKIEDDGIPFNPLEYKIPRLTTELEKRPIGKMGIYIVQTIMDEIKYSRKGGKNILAMKKSLKNKSKPKK